MRSATTLLSRTSPGAAIEGDGYGYEDAICAANPADTEGGDWAATSSAKTHFSFAMPDDYSEFVSAKVVMIGKKDKDTGADVYL